MSREVTLPSGAVLVVAPAPFQAAKALYQAVLEEVKGVKVDPLAEVDVNLFKDMFCIGLSSKKIESALAECLKRVTYNGLKVDSSTFEPVESRQDYVTACFEVAKENIEPFTKSLYAQYAAILGQLQKVTSSQA
jgi:hypothetical protein